MSREAEHLDEYTTHASKGHFIPEGASMNRNYWLSVPTAALAGIAGVTLINSQPELACTFALLASLLMGLMTFLKANECAVMHWGPAEQFHRHRLAAPPLSDNP